MLATVLTDQIWPVTIVGDRYWGTYSGAKFLAFETEIEASNAYHKALSLI